MKFKWTDALCIQNEVIDNQHKELFNRLNRLYDAITEGREKEVIKEMINFLNEYVIFHFKDEETVMQNSQYPEYVKHKGEHVQFLKDFKKLEEQYSKSENKYEITLDIYNMCVLWLQKHIMEVDKKLGQFLIKGS